MHDVLWAKLRALGPVYLPVQDEIRRIQPWLPYSLRPTIWELFRWVEQYQQTADAADRLQLEQSATEAVRMKLINAPERAFLRGFVCEVSRALQESREQRLAVLGGRPGADADLDDRLVDRLAEWLTQHSTPRNRTLAALIARLLAAWRRERRGGGAA